MAMTTLDPDLTVRLTAAGREALLGSNEELISTSQAATSHWSINRDTAEPPVQG
jgi:hypothetical protein